MTVHVTASGTAWTSQSASLAEHGNARWLVADRTASTPQVPTILYVHGSGHPEDHFETATLWGPFRDRVIDEGWAVVEGLGGAVDDGTAKQNWGRPASQRAYSAYLEHVAGQLDLGPVVVLGRSMGGIGASNLVVRDPFVSSVACGLMLHQSACNLRALCDVPAGRRGQFWPELWQAWGTQDRESFLARSAEDDPVGFDPGAWRDQAVWVGVATGDETVPAQDHGLAMRRRWAGQPRLDRVEARDGGNHTNQGLFGAVESMMSFLYAVARTSPPTSGGYRVVSRSRWSGTARQQVVSRRRFEG